MEIFKSISSEEQAFTKFYSQEELDLGIPLLDKH
jgi:hypothetical protein